MTFNIWWLIALPLFFTLGWIAARIDIRQLLAEASKLPAAYFKGLNYLITNQHDKAADAFIEAAESNQESLELHFALGSLLRKRGEIDRAIHMHLHLLERNDLPAPQRTAVMAELAQDYLKAGLYDRAEDIFKTLDDTRYRQPALRALLEIYVREREWERAIESARELERLSGISFKVDIAHYYCEMATKSILANQANQAEKELEQALDINKNCVRANIMLGDIQAQAGQHAQAISIWKRIEFQNPQFLGLIAPKMLASYRLLNQTDLGIEQLKTYLQSYHLPALVAVLDEAIMQTQGAEEALKFARHAMTKQPSLQALEHFLDAGALITKEYSQDITLMQQTVRHAIGTRVHYRCEQCGFKAKNFHWQCPACNAWEAIPPEASELTS